MNRDVVISLHHLTKWYGKTRGIEDVTFDVHRGEVFGFLGPNGAGKTTTIRTLLGLIRATSGSASILGLDALRNNLEIRKRVGYLPGVASTYSNYTARGYLEFFARMRKVDCTKKINEYAERLNLDLGVHIHDLSKGNKQKVSVIQAFMHQPEVLFLDEPTSGLDPIVQREFEVILDETKARGATVVLSSHVLSEVEHLASRVAIIDQGHIVRVDEISQLKLQATSTIDLTFDSDVMADHFASIPNCSVIEVKGRTVSISIRGSEKELLKRAVELGVVEVRTHELSLDEIFVQLVGQK